MEAAIKALPILTILHGLNVNFQKNYCYPSQLKIMELLKNRKLCEISIATINRHLKAAEEAGYLKRKRRIRRDPKKGIVFQSTLYTIKHAGYVLLSTIGIKVWDVVNRIFNNIPKTEKKDDDPGLKKEADIEYNGYVGFRKRHPKIRPWFENGVDENNFNHV